MYYPAIEEDKEKEEKLFFAAYILWMTAGVFKLTQFDEISALDTIFGYMQNASYVFLICLFFMKKRDTLKDVIGIGLILLCCILADYAVYEKQIIPVAIFLYFAVDIDFKKILKCTLILQAVIMAITMSSCALGIIENVTYTRHEVVRNSLGYNFCTYSAHLLLFMSLMWFCLREKIRAFEVIIALALNYIVYLFTNGRADFYLAVIGILGITIWQKEFQHDWLNQFRSFVVKFGFLFIAVISILAQAFYNPENVLMAALNNALSGRLNLGHQALEQYGLSLFGHPVRWIGWTTYRKDPSLTYNCVDNSYLRLGISYGIIFLALLAVGFYLAGKYLIDNKEYKLSWAVLVMLVYFSINLYIHFLAFHVFILLLGSCLKKTSDKDKIPIRDRIAPYLNEKTKHCLRVILFTGLLIVVAYVQCRGSSYGSSNSRMFAWITAAFLLVLGCLCWEKEFEKFKLSKNMLGNLVLLFLVVACVSDFFISKRFQYSAFAMLAFGAFFCRCWSTMEQPGQIIREFKMAFKIWFAASVVYCIFCRPSMSGICYSGMYPDAESFALCMLIASVIFLSDIELNKQLWYNSVGLISSLYFLWLSKKTIVLLMACLLLVCYLVYQACSSRKKDRHGREGLGQKINWKQIGLSLILCLGTVFLIRELLPRIAITLGLQVVYENDKVEKIGVTFFQLISVEEWRHLFHNRWNYCVAYLQNMNLLGHNYLLEISGKEHWSPNGILMIGYRYGIIAGICYAGVMIGYLVQAVKCSWEIQEFFPVGIAMTCVIVGMFVTIERPFVCLAWMVLWLGICWVSCVRKK